MEKRIFTFWEPRSAIPGYLKLCLATWRKFLPNWQVEVLDYERLREFLPQDEIDAILCRDMKLFNQADAVRCALLRRHGGVWLDLDTVVLRGDALDRFMAPEASVICDEADGIYGAFFAASKPNCTLMDLWYGELVRRVAEYRRFSSSLFMRLLHRKRWRKVRRWDFVLNDILDPMLKELHPESVAVFREADLHAHPEQTLDDGRTGRKSRDVYAEYWFTGDAARGADAKAWATGGLAMLHNSWTPPEFRRMDEEAFLATGCRLAKLLKEVL